MKKSMDKDESSTQIMINFKEYSKTEIAKKEKSYIAMEIIIKAK